MQPIHHHHPWNLSVQEAQDIQNQLRSKVIAKDDLPTHPVTTVAGVDVGFANKFKITCAAATVFSFPELELIETAIAQLPTTFPYVPGYLSFREIPTILEALQQLSHVPDLILCDGQGYAHPRRFGLACHLGVLLDRPTIGVAKSRYIGTYQDVPNKKGSWVYLYDNDEIIGAVVRTRSNVKPLFISVGHRISLPTAIAYTLNCTTKYRLPETTRLADKLASRK